MLCCAALLELAHLTGLTSLKIRVVREMVDSGIPSHLRPALLPPHIVGGLTQLRTLHLDMVPMVSAGDTDTLGDNIAKLTQLKGGWVGQVARAGCKSDDTGTSDYGI